MEVSAVFYLVAELAMARGCPMPISGHPGNYPMQIDRLWKATINGRRETVDGIPPFHVALEFNGWPAGLVGATGGGIICAGAEANEDNLIEALRAQLEASRADH